MIDVFGLYQSFKSYVNTYIGGWYRPKTDFLYACNDLSIKFWVKWTGEAEKSQEARDNLRPFLKSQNVKVDIKGPYGTFSPPKDYERFAAARIIITPENKCIADLNVNSGECDGVETDAERTENYYDNVQQWEVTLVDDQKWGAANKHLTKKPTFERPIMRMIDEKFQVSPRSVSVVVLDYYIKPELATFEYKKTPADLQAGTGDTLVPDPNNIPLPWPATMRDEFLIALGERYGLFTRDAFVSQVSQQFKQAV